MTGKNVIKAAIDKVTELDAAGWALVLLRCDREADIRRTVEGYVHIARYAPKVKTADWQKKAAEQPILNIKEVPAMFLHVIEEAFTPTAAQGGFAGATAMMAVRFGMARGIFANEAGLGSGPIAHATATSTPIRQATIGMLDVFITTMIVCSMTGFAILVTGEWTAVGAQGASLTARAFETALPGVGSAIVAISLVMFAFTTILGWDYYGERCLEYLSGGSKKAVKTYRWLYILAVFIGPYMTVSAVWTIADIFNACMAIPNMIALIALSGVVVKETKDYFKRLDEAAGDEDNLAPRDTSDDWKAEEATA